MLTTLTTSDLTPVSGGATRARPSESSQLDPGHMIDIGGEKLLMFNNGNYIRYPGWSGTGDAPRWESYDKNNKFIQGADNPRPKTL